MKLSRNAITMLKSAYQSVYLKGLVLGVGSICCMPAQADFYHYTRVDGKYLYGDEKPTVKPNSTIDKVLLVEDDVEFYLTPTKNQNVPASNMSWATLNEKQYGQTENDNMLHLEPHFGRTLFKLFTFIVHNGDSLNSKSSFDLKGISTKRGRIRFEDQLSEVKTDFLDLYANIDAKKVSTMVVKGRFSDTGAECLKPDEHYSAHKAEFSKLVLDGTAVNVVHNDAFVSAQQMLLRNKAEGSIRNVKVSELNVGSASDGGARLAIDKLYAGKIKVVAPWGQDPSILAYNSFLTDKSLTNYNRDSMTGTNADISVGQNSAIVYGNENGVMNLQVAKDIIKKSGGISENGIKAMMYLNNKSSFKIGEDIGITIDGNSKSPATEKNTFKIGSNSAVVLGGELTEKALLTEENSGWKQAAITFTKPGTVTYEDSS